MRTHLLLLHGTFMIGMLITGPAGASLSQPYYAYDSPIALTPRPPLLSLSPISFPTMKVIRPMRITVTPAHPEPFEEVSVTISGKTSDPHLTLGTVTVNHQGADITIDLDWITFRTRLGNNETCVLFSGGYGIEQINPLQSSPVADEPYEITQSLGSFDEGSYRIHVYSHGALEGEAWATFRVRSPISTFSDLMDTDWPW